MPSKKDLEQIFNISDNTVYKTLKACGLDTAKEDYLDDEIENFFKPARKMLDAGKKYKDVEERFQTKDVPSEHQNANSHGASDAVGIATAEMAADLVQGAVKQITPFIPQLVAHTLAEEMRSPEMKKAFEETRSQMLEKNSNTSNAGADFLLQKMNNTSMQLGGSSPNQAQLPEASQEQK